MTMTPFTCADFGDSLAAYLERDTSRDVDAAMSAHVVACETCAALLQELTTITSQAAVLPDFAPTRDLWSGIAARIDAPVIAISATRRTATAAPARVTRRWWAHPALAAAALVGITAGVTHYMTKESIEGTTVVPGIAQAPVVDDAGAMVDAVPPAQVAAAASDAGATPDQGDRTTGNTLRLPVSGQRLAVSGPRVPSSGERAAGTSLRTSGTAAGDLQLVSYRPGEIAALDSLYYREIIRLRQLLNERSADLDSSTVSVINRNMLVIDRAIQECREALAADPASKFLNQQLNQALETKIELLRTAAMMPVGS